MDIYEYFSNVEKTLSAYKSMAEEMVVEAGSKAYDIKIGMIAGLQLALDAINIQLNDMENKRDRG